MARADHQHQIGLGGHELDGVLAVLGGVADVVLLGADDAGEALAQGGDDGAGVVHRQGGLGDVGEHVGVGDRAGRPRRRRSRPGRCRPSTWPIVPSTSGWPLWPIMMTSRPWSRMRATSRCTLVTSGQVASNTRRPRASASVRTDWGTPWALKIDGVAGGHVGQVFDEDRALGAQAVDDEAVVHDLVADVDRRAEAGRAPVRRSRWHVRRRRRSRGGWRAGLPWCPRWFS